MANSDVKTIAVAGLGSMAKFLIEELLKANPSYQIIAISRAERPGFTSLSPDRISLRVSDYSTSSFLSILNDTSSLVLFSFMHDNTYEGYNIPQESMLKACQQSKTCKWFVPSECGGDLEDVKHEHDRMPRFYEKTHFEFRKVLKAQKEVKWTLFNQGWFMDYFLGLPSDPNTPSPSHLVKLPSLPPSWPIDLSAEPPICTFNGTGKEPITWTSGRDSAKAMVRLVEVATEERKGDWPEKTYVAGETATWEKAVGNIEKFYNVSLHRQYITSSYSLDIIRRGETESSDMDQLQLWTAYMAEWQFSGASAVPEDLVEEQRRGIFKDLTFEGIVDFLQRVKINGKA